MSQQNYPYRQIQQTLQVSLGFISKWNHVYDNQGVDGLRLAYAGSQGYLTASQKQEILKALNSQDTWQIEEVMELIEDRYGIVFQSKQSYYALLHQAKLSWKKSQATHPSKDEQQIAQKNKRLWR
jgi:putative transposase